MKTRNKALVLTLCAVLLVVATVMGTLAYLTAETQEITNTFTVGNINITLTENKGGENKEFKMVPGCTIDKDPKVKVVDGSEDCILFVKVEKANDFDTYLTYEMAGGWNELTGNAGVYYRTVKSTDAVKEFSVLKDDKVMVKTDVNKTQMDALTADTYPTLTFKAYACQLTKDGTTEFTPAEAWAKVNPTPAP